MVRRPPVTPRGVFIALEGGDGAGKSTQLELLAEALRLRGVVDAPGRPELVLTREPGGTEVGAQIRQALLHGGDVAPLTEALLYAADRAQHVAQVVGPALQRGAVVVSDRYLDSSIAYQVEGRGLTEAQVRGMNAYATGGLLPHLTVLLDIDPDEGSRRRAAGGGPPDRLERAGAAFHRRVNARYRSLMAANPDRYAVVDAAQPPEAVHAQVLASVMAVLAERGLADLPPSARTGKHVAGVGQ
ncbi:MAG: dTMP kinase [Bifidobacteriaceae bacterium]|jgi:dTMP kinase|nr:dTMP kinase [Bifidobacteriaceae bacterium]